MNRWLCSLRVDEWGIQLVILWAVAGVYYGGVGVELQVYARQVALVSLWSAFLLAGVYVFNDFFDRHQDVHKPRFKRVSAERPALTLALSIVLMGVGLILVDVLALNSWIKLIAILQVVALVGYSVAGVRLKEKGWLGIFTAAGFQRIPSFLMVVLAFPVAVSHAIGLLFWLLLVGLLFICEHQLEDLESDRKTGVRTWAARAGPTRAAGVCHLFYRLLWLATAGAAATIFFVNRSAGSVGTAVLLLTISVVFIILLRKRYALNRPVVPRAEVASGRTGRR